MSRIKYSKIILLAIIILTISFSLLAPMVRAETVAKPGEQGWNLIPTQCTTGGGQGCGVCQLIQAVINFSQLLFGLVGGIALIMFIWAGFGLATSYGNPEKISANRKILISTIVGIAIVLLAWTAVNAIVVILTGQAQNGVGLIKLGDTGQVWAEYCQSQGQSQK